MGNLKFKEIPKDDETGNILHDQMTDEFQNRFVCVGEDNTCLPIHFEKYADIVENFEVHNSDVWICSYPKTGTTWAQEMVWLIVNDLNFEVAKSDLHERVPFLELCALYDFKKMSRVMEVDISTTFSESLQFVKEQQNPRFMKSHLPWPLLPRELRSGTKTPKIVYVMRNPKDTCVSYYHHSRLLQGCKASLEDFSKVFLADKVMYGSYWKHLLGFWNKRNLQNLLIIKYEDMKEDLPLVIKEVTKFFGKTFNDEQIDKLAEHLSFESMKHNQFVNNDGYVALRRMKGLTIGDGSFLRSGTVGSYKAELSLETIKKFNDWSKANVKGTDFGEEYCQ